MKTDLKIWEYIFIGIIMLPIGFYCTLQFTMWFYWFINIFDKTMKKVNFLKKYLEIDFNKINKITYKKIQKKFEEIGIIIDCFSIYDKKYASICLFIIEKNSNNLTSCLKEDFYSDIWQNTKFIDAKYKLKELEKITIEDFLK